MPTGLQDQLQDQLLGQHQGQHRGQLQDQHRGLHQDLLLQAEVVEDQVEVEAVVGEEAEDNNNTHT